MAEHRQPGYLEQFDSSTVFYDIFDSGEGTVILSGPPLLNLRRDLTIRFQVDGRDVQPELADAKLTQRSHLQAQGRRLRISGQINVERDIGCNYRELFRDHRVLTTLQKDNDLEWIADWAGFHILHHGVTGLLIYDNGSTRYTPEQLDASLERLGVRTVVVDWPYRYGPGSGPSRSWDSNFCQVSQLEHARFRFLPDAELVINADIDELIVTPDGRPILEYVQRHGNGALRYPGRWIEAVDKPRLRRHAHYCHYDPQIEAAAMKWSARPGLVPRDAIWTPHEFAGWRAAQTDEVLYRHFRAINTGWKYDRLQRILKLQEVEIDHTLEAAFSACEGSRFSFVTDTEPPPTQTPYSRVRLSAQAAARNEDWTKVVDALAPSVEAEAGLWPLEAYLDLGQAFTQLGRLSEAASAFALARSRWPSDGRAWRGGAYAAVKGGDWPSAANLWQGCMDRFPRDQHAAWWWASFAEALAGLGRHGEAAQACQTIRERWPDDLSGWRGGALAASKLGLLPEAAELWQACLARSPEANQSPWWWTSLADVLSRAERLEEAAAALAVVRERWPDDIRGWRGGAYAAQRLDDWQDAAELWRGCLRLTAEERQDAATWCALGNAMRRSGRSPEARDAYRHAATRWPSDAGSLRGYLDVTASASGFPAAARLWDRLGRPCPAGPEFEAELILTLLRAGRSGEARDRAAAMWQDDPGSLHGLRARIEVCRKLGDERAAFETLGDCVATPGFATAFPPEVTAGIAFNANVSRDEATATLTQWYGAGLAASNIAKAYGTHDQPREATNFAEALSRPERPATAAWRKSVKAHLAAFLRDRTYQRFLQLATRAVEAAPPEWMRKILVAAERHFPKSQVAVELRGASDRNDARLSSQLPRATLSTSPATPIVRDGGHDDPQRHVFIVTYGRSGSTLLQNLINMLPGACIRGENNLLSLHLARTWASMSLHKTASKYHRVGRPLTADNPWYGAENVDPDRLGGDLADLLRRRVLAPPPGTEISGFKEIRWHRAGAFFNTHLDFIRKFFPGTRFIFNTRNHADVARSGWWRDHDPGEVEATLSEAESLYSGYRSKHPDLCWQVHYDDYVRDIEAFRPIFEAVGRPFDRGICEAALRQKLVHMKRNLKSE